MARRYRVEPKTAKRKNLVLNILLVIFSLVFIVAAYLLVDDMFIRPYKNDKVLGGIESELEEIQNQIQQETSKNETSKTETSKTEEEEPVEQEYVGFTESINALRDKYPDLTGWIRIEGEDISYPVMTGPEYDPEYYLKRNYTGAYSEYGSIFQDEHSSVDSVNQLLHGHNMLDGSMFQPLEDFNKLEVYKESPVIYYDTYKEPGIYKIVSVFKTNVLKSQGPVFDYFQCDFPTEDAKMQYIYEVMNRSMIDTGVDIKADDTFVTLSTCSYEFDHFRTVVVARKVREGEDTSVDTSKATEREDVVFPLVWYNYKYGQDPNFPETFEEAKEQGITDWWYVE